MGSDIRLYFDENVETVVADQMRALGIECITVRDLNLQGDTDQNHLQRATKMGYVLCTYDIDFMRLHAEGFPHAGIVFAIENVTSIGDWVRGLELICGVMTADEMKNHQNLAQETPAFRHGEECAVSFRYLTDLPLSGGSFRVATRKDHSEPVPALPLATPLARVKFSSTILAVGTVPNWHWLRPRMPV